MPQSNLEAVQDAKLADALAGRYQFSIKSVIKEAWIQTNGFKGTFWGASILALVCSAAIIALLFIPAFIGGGDLQNSAQDALHAAQSSAQSLFKLFLALFFVVGLLVLIPVGQSLLAGMWMIGLHRATHNPCRAKMIFNYFHSKWPLTLVFLWLVLLQIILELIVKVTSHYLLPQSVPILILQDLLLLLVLYSIAFVYAFSVPLVVEKKLSAWRALETSRRTVGHRFFKIVGLFLVVGAVNFLPYLLILILAIEVHLGFMALAVVYFWLWPFSLLSMSILYREIFGVSSIAASPTVR
jgi:hypothetical protein